jgi:hypothetical protein
MQNIFIGFAARASDFLSICLNLLAKGALNLFDGTALNWLVHDHFPCMEECERVGRRACMFVCQPAGIRNVLDIAVHTIHMAMANGYRTTSQARRVEKSCDAVFLSNKSIRGMARHQKEWRGSFIFYYCRCCCRRVEWRERKRKCTHRLIAYTHVKTKVETLETAMRMELNHPP